MNVITSYTSLNSAERLPDTYPEYLIMHYTACDLDSSLKILTDCDSEFPVSSHYLIAENGDIYQLVDEEKRAWHAGKQSAWKNRESLNTWSIGIELVNPGHGPNYRSFPEVQMESLLELSQQIIARHNIPSRHILGHSDIAPGRKIDPGELFDWQWLAENGVGFYPQATPSFASLGPNILSAQQNLKKIGYSIPLSGVLDQMTRDVIHAFQMHFSDDPANGIIDEKLMTLIAACLP